MNGIQMEGKVGLWILSVVPINKRTQHWFCLQCSMTTCSWTFWMYYTTMYTSVGRVCRLSGLCIIIIVVNIEGGGISASSSLHHMQSSRKLKSTFSGYGAILLSFFCIWRPRNSFNGGLVRKGLPGYHNYYENFYWQDSRFLNNRFRQKIKL